MVLLNDYFSRQAVAMKIPQWEHFEHKADMGVRGYGQSVEQAFEQAALAMMAIITDLSRINPLQKIEIQCQEADRELLLTDWLNSVIFEISTHKLLFCRFELEINADRLQATAWGEPIDVARHRPAVEIKGATYTELAVHQQDNYWIAQCVVDV